MTLTLNIQWARNEGWIKEQQEFTQQDMESYAKYYHFCMQTGGCAVAMKGIDNWLVSNYNDRP